MREITLGNLFSGSGTWELAAQICGIKPVWEAEVEPFPVALEAKRFPECKQLGDVRSINGAEIEPVDIFTNSSPCQSLSIAGKRGGFADLEKSGLFMEAIRITKEMRDADIERLRSRGAVEPVRLARPRFWCWENVPGALSSSGGADFRSAIEEVARIVEPEAVIPLPPKGKWSNAGVVNGDGWQIAWRIMDAQYFGVAQRRRRVFLVADFGAGHGGGKACEILFERESVSWDFAKIAEAWKDTSSSLGSRISEAGRIVRDGIRMGESNLVGTKSGDDNGVRADNDGVNEPVVYNGETITSPGNWSNPKPGDPCHSLTNDSRNYLVNPAGESQKN